jgi:CheY-like chemotaxis protein
MNEKKILIVDDSRIILKTVSDKLRPYGYRALTAADGGEAISTVRRERPDLILLDINFPPDVAHGGGVSWDGFLIMDWLRRMDEGKDIPVIMLTSSDPAKYKDRSLAAGAVAFFHKPFDHDELLRVIGQTLGESVAEGSIDSN